MTHLGIRDIDKYQQKRPITVSDQIYGSGNDESCFLKTKELLLRLP
jgi:hypothetical protein